MTEDIVIPNGRKATIQDIARDTGLSTSTVSRALAGTRKVSEDLVKVVEESAGRLRYRTNKTARALRSSTTGIVGMVVPDIVNPFFPSIVEAVEKALAEQQLSLVLCTAQGSARTEAKRIDLLLEQNVDALLISPVDYHESALAVRQAAETVHVIQVDRVANVKTDSVLVDQGAGMRLLIEHLADRHVKSCSYVGADRSSSTEDRRYRSYLAETQRLGIDRIDFALHGAFSVEWGEEAADLLLEGNKNLPDAVLCANDSIAVGFARRMRRNGVAIPGDLLVTGFDNSAIGRYFDVPLTTIQQPLDQLGAEAVRMVLPLGIPKSRNPRSLLLEPTLIARESTGSEE